jgi:sugar lactone lactonase YvrE
MWRNDVTPRRPASRLAAAAILVLLAAAPAAAVTPILWTVESLDEFEKGKPDGVAIGATGELTLSPGLVPLNVPALEQASEPFLWSLVLDSKGNLFAGGGRSGSIYRVPKGTAGSLYYETGDLAVHALAVDRNDVLYAGTMPQGKVVRVTAEGKGDVFFQPEDRYIWSLAAGPKGELYAATGERGIVYKLTGPGKSETFFDSAEFHIVSLAVDAQGNVLAGSDGKGLLYRISPQGKATVLYDSPLHEITAVAVDARGVVYAAAIGADGEAPLPLPQPLPAAPTGHETAPAGLPGQPPVALPGIDEGATPTVTVTTVTAQFAQAGPPPKSEVYRIDPDGSVMTLWSSPSEVVYALTLDATGRPVIGTGEPARVRVITGAQQSILVAKLPQSQVTSLAIAGAKIDVATSNVGRLFALDPADADAGTYLSETQDAVSVARWGRISWRATVPQGSKVEITTRTGNSAVPDETWSEWSPAYATADGSAVTSPPGRFLQWRARLSRSGGDGPTLSAVSVAYAQANLPPVIRRLSIQPPGLVRERSQSPAEVDPADLAFTGIRGPGAPAASGGGSSGEKRIYVRGMRSLEWDADDPNGDSLSCDLFFRGDGETAWKPLARGLREPYFAFDSMQMPDGLYRIRLDVNDAPSNPGDKAKSASQATASFLIDNTPPQVQVTAKRGAKAGAFTIDVAASDTIGPIARADASVDAARWVPLLPADGVSDSRAESYSLPVESLRPGEHTVIVRVTDLLGNVGAGKATFNSE